MAPETIVFGNWYLLPFIENYTMKIRRKLLMSGSDYWISCIWGLSISLQDVLAKMAKLTMPLSNIEHRDLKTFLSKYPQIDTLIYTSKNLVPMVNHFADKGYHERWDSKKKNGFVQINSKIYRVYILYSPSPNALRGVEEETRKAQYIEFFGMK